MRKRLSTIWLMAFLLILAGCPPADSAPVLSALVPKLIPTGSGNTNITLNGTGFQKTASVQWNNALLLSTTYISSKQLVATVPATELQFPGVATVRALQGTGTNQQATASLSITISNVAPTLTSMTPQHALVGGAAVTLTVVGTNFNSSSVVNWNTTALVTTLVSSTQLSAVVPSTLIAAAGTEKVTVDNLGTGGGSSLPINFSVVPPVAITTTTLPGGSIGSAYTATLTATGGTLPYTWNVTAGTLPAGLTLNSTTGVISGTPTGAGTASFSITVADSTGSLALKKFGQHPYGEPNEQPKEKPKKPTGKPKP